MEVAGTVTTVRAHRDGGYDVIVRKADDTKVLVELDKDFKVTGTKDLPAKTERAGHHGKRGSSTSSKTT